MTIETASEKIPAAKHSQASRQFLHSFDICLPDEAGDFRV